MTVKIVRGADLGVENRKITLKNLHDTYPTRLEYNVKGEVYFPENETRLVVPSRGIDLLPGNQNIDLHVRIQRSGNDLSSIESDEERVQAFFDALSFSELGKAFEVMPRLPSAETSIRVPLNKDKITEAIEVLEAMALLSGKKKDSLDSALKWYRESFSARSIFNRYSMLWNSLEIVALHWGEEYQAARRKRRETAKSFLAERGGLLTLDDLLYVQNEILQDSMRDRMERGFEKLFVAEATFPIQMCFHRLPEVTRLWKTRNDINHGNIVQRNPRHRDRVLSVLFDLDKVAWNTISEAMGLGRKIPWER